MKDGRHIRFLDRVVGKLLCQIGTLLSARRSAVPPPFPEAGTCLFVEFFEMGAAIMAAPAITYVQRQNPKAKVFYLTSKTCVKSWEVLGLVPTDHIIALDDRSPWRFLWSIARALPGLRRARFDLIVDLGLFYRLSAIISWMSGAKRRAGFYRYRIEGLDRGELMNIRCSFNQNLHIAQNFLALTKAGCENSADWPNLKAPVTVEELQLPLIRPAVQGQSARERLLPATWQAAGKNRIILIAPSVGPVLAVRDYPRHSYVDLIKRILADYPTARVALIGTQVDKAACEEIVQRTSDPRCIDLSGKTTFSELIELLALADLLVCNDAGPAHFAALVRTKTVALFSTDSPFVYGPLGEALIVYSFYHCSPCISASSHKQSACADNKCLQAISPAQVFHFVKLALDGHARFGTINNVMPYLHRTHIIDEEQRPKENLPLVG